jgi:hypothetical protein
MSEELPIDKRAWELANMPMKDLPEMCKRYVKHLSVRVGICGEVYMTVFYTYLQLTEGYKCRDELYIPPSNEITIYKQLEKEYNDEMKG